MPNASRTESLFWNNNLIHLDRMKKVPPPFFLSPRMQVLHRWKTAWAKASAAGAFPSIPHSSPQPFSMPALAFLQSDGEKSGMWSGQPLPCFFPSVSFTVYCSRSCWHQRGGRNTRLGPPFLTPAHTQAGVKQSWNRIIDNSGKNLPTDTVILTRSCLSPVTFFSLEYGVKAALCCEAEGEVSPNSSTGKPSSSLQHNSTGFNTAMPSDSSSNPATGVLKLIFIFIHCPVFNILFFSL